VNSLSNIKETVYERKEQVDCCNFDDLSAKLAPKKTSKRSTAKRVAPKATQYFDLKIPGDYAIIQKLNKDARLRTFEFLTSVSLDDMDGKDPTPLLSFFEKLSSQYKNMPESKKKSMLEDKPDGIEVVLARRLAEIPSLQQRIDTLKFKYAFISESADITEFARIVTKAADHIMDNDKLRQLLQIMVDAINQGIKDFAEKEKLSFDEYKMAGVPVHDILKFMSEDKVMKIVSDKVLRSSLELQKITIPSLDLVKFVHIEDKILSPLNHLKKIFKKISGIVETIPSLIEYMDETREHLETIESFVESMQSDLRSLSVYLGESGEYLKIKDAKTKEKTYTVLELVEALLAKWHGIAAKAAERMRKEKKKRAQQPDTDIHSVMEKAMRVRKRGTQGDDDDDDEWDSD
tara:strand:- start:3880 stop:5091 length:1212 start_codon:yes stop_codon:yes gene_type:complete